MKALFDSFLYSFLGSATMVFFSIVYHSILLFINLKTKQSIVKSIAWNLSTIFEDPGKACVNVTLYIGNFRINNYLENFRNEKKKRVPSINHTNVLYFLTDDARFMLLKPLAGEVLAAQNSKVITDNQYKTSNLLGWIWLLYLYHTNNFFKSVQIIVI